MPDSHYRPLARINPVVLVCEMAFYAISLRHSALGIKADKANVLFLGKGEQEFLVCWVKAG